MGKLAELRALLDDLESESAALRLISYHGAPWSDDGKPWMADLTDDDVRKIVALLDRARAAVAALEGETT